MTVADHVTLANGIVGKWVSFLVCLNLAVNSVDCFC